MHLDKDDEMKFHIVGNGESIDDILNGYDITFDELKNENKHIRIWNNLIPGTKLKIPVLTEAIVEEINEIEPFIEDYYPKIKVEEEEYTLVEKQIEDDIKLDYINENNDQSEIIEDNIALKEDNNINEEIIDSVKEENKERDYNIYPNKQLYVRYVYPPMYYRPIIYIIPNRKMN